MSGIRPEALRSFYASLHARGVTTESLAGELNASPAVVRKLLGGLRRRRGLVWAGLVRKLSERERELLASVEQCPAWNMRRAMRNRARWDVDKVAGLAETYGGNFSVELDKMRGVEA